MKIALVGYGKMGHAIGRIALERGHEIAATVDTGEESRIDSPEFRSADVVIEFTRPDAAVENYRRLIPTHIPVVSGTTGWTAALPEVEALVKEHDATLFWTSNFSIGVNLFRKVNSFLARIMGNFPQYHPAMKEIHHIHKLDHPSGTAITLANDLMEADPMVKQWTEDESLASDPESLLISHERQGEVPGTHIITWTSPVDAITLEHRAFSRDGFALGAVLAAEWVVDNPDAKGILGMDALLKNIC